MRRGACSALLLAVWLAGCVAPPPTPVVKGGATPRPSTGPRASTPPTGPASAAPARTPVLVRPLPDGVPLAGRIRADAAFLRTAGGVSLAGDALRSGAGASIVAAGAGNAVAVTEDGLKAKGGLGIVAAGGGNVLAAGGTSLIGPDGASLIGPDGASLVGADGASLVGADGASLIGADGASYQLAQAPAAAGQQAPVGGMLVSAVSLATRQYLPIGRTPDGKPVYTVFSDAAGGFALTVPKGEEANVLVVASLPGSRAAGTVLNALTPPAAGVEVDEDTAQVTRYLRRAMVRRLADPIAAPSLDAAMRGIEKDKNIDSEAGRAMFKGLAEAFQALGMRRGIPALADRALAQAQAEALAAALIDDALARLDVAELLMDGSLTPKWKLPGSRVAGFPEQGTRVVDVLKRCFQDLRGHAALKMARPDGTYAPLPASFFARVAVGWDPERWIGPALDGGYQDWYAEILTRYPAGPYPVMKPSDVGDFLVDRYLGVNREFLTDGVVAAFVLLDPRAYPAEPTRFPAPGAGGTAAAAMLERIHAYLPALADDPLTPGDRQFREGARAAAAPYVDSVSAAGLAFFVQTGLAVTADAARAQAVADAVALPTAVPAEP